VESKSHDPALPEGNEVNRPNGGVFLKWCY
jgi:hypothetical protein